MTAEIIQLRKPDLAAMQEELTAQSAHLVTSSIVMVLTTIRLQLAMMDILGVLNIKPLE